MGTSRFGHFSKYALALLLACSATAASTDADAGLGKISKSIKKAKKAVSKVATTTAAQAAQLSQTAGNQLTNMPETVTDALDTIDDHLGLIFGLDPQAILKLAAIAAVEKEKNEILALGAAGYSITGNAANLAIVDRLVAKAAGRNRDAQATADMNALVATKEIAGVLAKNSSGGGYRIRSVSLGMGGNGAYYGGAEGAFGFVANATGETRGYTDIGLVAGAAANAELSYQFGIWTSDPSELAGSYIAIDVYLPEADGFGVQVLFNLPESDGEWLDFLTGNWSYAPVGYVVSLGIVEAGQGEFAMATGYSWLF